MAVYVNNITVDTGTNFYREFYLDSVDGTPLDLTGYTAKSEVRKHPQSVGAATTFSVSFVDRSNGLIRLSLNRKETVKLKPGRYVYDVMFTEGQGPSSNAGVWSTLDANNSGSYRGFTINAWSSFMNTYAYSRVPQSGSLSSQPDPYGVKTDSYVVNFPYTGAYQIEAAADNVGTVTINNTTFNAVNYNDTNVGVGSISLEKGNHTVTLTQQNTQTGTDNFADNPVGIAVSITYIGGTAPGKKSIVLEGMFNARLDVTPFQAAFDDFPASETPDPSDAGAIRQFAGVETDQQSVRSTAGFKRYNETFTGGTLGNADQYGVIALGVFTTCQGDLGDLETLLDATNSQGITNLEFLNNYLSVGGVIWFRGEYGNCVGNTVSNNILAKLGTSIRIDNVTLPSSSAGWSGPLQSGRDNAKLVYTSGKFESVQESTGLPIPLGTSWASLSVNSGTPVYKTSDESRTAFAYERKGNGIIFVGGETLSSGSGFAVGNNDDEGDYWYAPTKELYAALRDLVTNG